MNEEDKAKLLWSGAKALIAGAVKYDFKKSIPSIYSLLLENSPWHATVDYVAAILKKYGGDGTTQKVIEKVVIDVAGRVQNESNS
jgi:hypothetical protein